MIIFKVFFILSLLSYSINVFSGTVLPPHPIETIAGGEESCIDSKDSKCKPWVVNIRLENESGKHITSCSGSLISPSYVLTAAHCQGDSKIIKTYSIVNYKKKVIGTASYQNFVPYSDSEGKFAEFAEFAIIKLDKPTTLNNYGHVRRFFDYDEAYEKIDKNYYNASVYGYGRLGIDPKTGNQIKNTEKKQRRADVNIVTYAIDYELNHGLLIKENKDLKPGVIQPGDSGGPIIWHDTIIGVASTGRTTLKDSNKSRPFFFASDVTGKYLDNNFIGKRNLGSWFSQNMKKIWIDNPDWGEKLSRRRKSIPVEGFGRPSSEINLRYSIDHKDEENTKCPVDKNGTWKCDIPYDTYFTETVSEGKEYVITITAEEFNKGDASWESDTITATIPNAEQEISIIYPSDKSIVLTKNFTIRGYAAPGSEIILKLIANPKYGDEVYTQDKLCAGLNNNELIKTGENGLWSCSINTDINLENSGKDDNYNINAEQEYKKPKKSKRKEIKDQVSISLKPEDYSTLNVEPNKNRKGNIYRKILEYNVYYANNAKLVCIFDGKNSNCKNNPRVKDNFHLRNLFASKKDFNSGKNPFLDISAIQKLENVDPSDPKLWYSHSFEYEGGYLMPSFNKEYPMESPTKISPIDIQNKKFTGFGGDDQRYTLSNDDILLPSEYSICMKKSSQSPSNSPQCNRDDKDKDIYVKIPLENGKYFSEIPIKYSDYGKRHDFPNWSLSLPSELKDGVYYIEIMDRIIPQGLNIEPHIWNGGLPKAYFEIGPLDVDITNPANTSDTVTTVSGTASIPGETVNVRKRKLTLSRGASGGDTADTFPDTICENAVVSDNGDWGCRTPVIFTEGTYELTAELMKDNKVVATKTEVVTVEEKEPEEDEPEIDNPANSPPIDPDGGLISLFGLFSAAATAAGAAAGLVFDLAGAASGAVLGAVSTIAGLTIPHWGLNIDTSKLHGGEAYKLVIQETKDGKKIGAPIEWHFTMPMRITEPQKNAHYRINNGISIQGEGTPGQLILIASSKLFLPPKETVLPPSSGTLICQTKVDTNGKWVCPNNPVMTAKQAGIFSLYAAQYQELHSKDLPTTHYKRTSEVSRQYEITQTRISITAPKQNAKFHRKPFDIAGIGEPGAHIHIGKNGNNKACDTTVTASGKWSCGPYLFGKGKFTVSAEQFISHELHSTAQVSYKIQPANGASSLIYLHFNHHSKY
ncbi:trypsin-like serine protease [Xenorhabdus sp. PB30.3]|uniref:trypsin-like serine protease n=1 Tax=Xenorhabdus sp. PB30.3 TaxID=2788941 RepID=UPI001E5BDFB5|nr:trypsin-like serine protease [Xenorhabdus sp. PB30.3]MCC8381267.1 trypsin-like serine protease [Xenorhabdus sp. PB30.3]